MMVGRGSLRQRHCRRGAQSSNNSNNINNLSSIIIISIRIGVCLAADKYDNIPIHYSTPAGGDSGGGAVILLSVYPIYRY